MEQLMSKNDPNKVLKIIICHYNLLPLRTLLLVIICIRYYIAIIRNIIVNVIFNYDCYNK